MLPWDGLPCCSGLLLKLQSGTYTARVCVTVVNKLSLRLRWLFAISRFAKNCWDEEKKEAKFWFSSARVAELALAYAPRKCLDTSHWTWFKYLKHKAKNNRKLLRRKASVYTSLKQIAGSNYAPKQLSDDLKNYRVLWQRMWKLKKRRGSSLQPQKADNISKAFGLAFPPPRNTQRLYFMQLYKFLQHLNLALNITSIHVLHKTQVKIGHLATLHPWCYMIFHYLFIKL